MQQYDVYNQNARKRCLKMSLLIYPSNSRIELKLWHTIQLMDNGHQNGTKKCERAHTDGQIFGAVLIGTFCVITVKSRRIVIIAYHRRRGGATCVNSDRSTQREMAKLDLSKNRNRQIDC